MNNELPLLSFMFEPGQIVLRFLALNMSNAERNAIASLTDNGVTTGYPQTLAPGWTLNIGHDFTGKALHVCQPGKPFSYAEELSNVAVKRMRAALKEAVDTKYTSPNLNEWTEWCLYQGLAIGPGNTAVVPLQAHYLNGKTIEASLFINPPKEYE